MTLQNCLEIAQDCELETVGEALLNIHIHAGSLLSYSTLHQELAALDYEAANLYRQTEFTNDSSVEEVLAHLGAVAC